MNTELQTQTDAVVKAITHLETTLHQDALLVLMCLGALLVVLCVVMLLRRS
jgi:hypothetical protein